MIESRRHLVTGIVVDFSGGLNASEAESVATYALTTAGRNGAFVGRGITHLKLRSAEAAAVALRFRASLLRGDLFPQGDYRRCR